jgi:nucleolar pre-ribosomal-associated protein 1
MEKRQRPKWQQGQEERLAKRPKVEAVEAPRIVTSRDIHFLLAFHQDPSALLMGLQQFKLFLDTIVYPKDGDASVGHKTGLLKSYLDSQIPKVDDGEDAVYVQHIIQTWQFASQKNDETLISQAVSILALLLKTISTKIEFKDHGLGICRTVLLPEQATLVSRGLSGSRVMIISPCTRLLTEIVSFDGGVMGRPLYAIRDQLFNPRTISKNLGLLSLTSQTDEEAKRRPSVRSNTIRYLLANLRLQQEGVVMDIIKQNNITKALFEKLPQDNANVIAEVLATIQESVIDNQALTWTNKSFMFNDRHLSLLANLYRAELSSEPLPDHNKPIIEIFHTFMMGLVTSPHAGVLRYSSGWYPSRRADQEIETYDEEEFDTESFKIYGPKSQPTIRNIPLAHFAQTLKPYALEKERELLLAVFKAASELVADYWFKRVNFSFEPKLTATWIGYSSFLFSSIDLPVPDYFGIKSGFSAKPPPASLAIEHILPLPLNHAVLSKCISSQSPLIKFFGVRIMIVAFRKLKMVLELYDQASVDSTTQLWARGKEALSNIFVQRIPEMKVVIQLFHKRGEDIMQREAIARLLSLYFEVLPTVAMDEHFDISTPLLKSLQETEEFSEIDSAEKQMELLELGHLLKIARRSVSMSWFKRPQFAKCSPFLSILLLYVKTDRASDDISNLLLSVIKQVGFLQQQTPTSSLDALCSSLGDEHGKIVSQDVLRFIDERLQRFQSHPIPLEDDMDELVEAAGIESSALKPISLWLAALLEKWPVIHKAYESALPELASWMIRFLSALKAIGEDERVLAVARGKLSEAIESVKIRRILENWVDVTVSGPRKTIDGLNGDLQKLDIAEAGQEQSWEDRLAVCKPPSEVKTPNFTKFKTADIITLLDSNSGFAELLTSLSSSSQPTRLQASSAIQHFMIRLQPSSGTSKSASVPEKEMIYLLLGSLVETFNGTQANGLSLPYLMSTFAAHALTVVMDPTHAMYVKVARLLTMRPNWNPTRLVKYFLDNIILAEPSEETDVAPWKEIDWLLDWLYDGLRTPADGDILRKTGAWEDLASLGAHPSLGSSKSTSLEEVTAGRIQSRVRSKIVRLVARALSEEQAGTLVTRSGGLSWIQSWAAEGWIDEGLAKAIRDGMSERGGERVAVWMGKDHQ